MRVRGSEWIGAVGERSRRAVCHNPHDGPKRDRDPKDTNDNFDNVVVEGQRQQVEGEISAEHRIDHASRRGAEEPHERDPQRRREKSNQGRNNKSNDPRRARRDDIRPGQYAQVDADKQADQKRDDKENCHTIFKRQPIATTLTQVLETSSFRGRCGAPLQRR